MGWAVLFLYFCKILKSLRNFCHFMAHFGVFIGRRKDVVFHTNRIRILLTGRNRAARVDLWLRRVPWPSG